MITSVKDLEKLLKMCRKQGVLELSIAGSVSFKLGDLPQGLSEAAEATDDTGNPYANFPKGDLSPEQLMFYSAGGLPENDPTLKEAS